MSLPSIFFSVMSQRSSVVPSNSLDAYVGKIDIVLLFLSIFTPNCVCQLENCMSPIFGAVCGLVEILAEMPEMFEGRNILAHSTRKSTGNAHSSIQYGCGESLVPAQRNQSFFRF